MAMTIMTRFSFSFCLLMLWLRCFDNRIRSGGITTANILTGGAGPMSGEGVVIKMKQIGTTTKVQDLLIPNSPRFLKFGTYRISACTSTCTSLFKDELYIHVSVCVCV
jgi:hypothetical protein